MSDSNSNNLPDDDADDRGDLDWSEFDWERYLRQQDEVVAEYWRCYEAVGDRPDRIDEVARRLRWEPALDEIADLPEDEDLEVDDGPYTVHRNHVFVATRALFAQVHAAWAKVAAEPAGLTPAAGAALASALHRAELVSVMALQALDLDDRTLGVAQLKRALAHLNEVFAHLPAISDNDKNGRAASAFCERVRPWLFDVREIFLRVLYECRNDLGREIEDEEED